MIEEFNHKCKPPAFSLLVSGDFNVTNDGQYIWRASVEAFSLLVSGDFNVTRNKTEDLIIKIAFSLLVSGDFNVT